MRARIFFMITALACALFATPAAPAAVVAGDADTEARVLSMEEFVTLATSNDTTFDEILIEELKLRYTKALALPAEDLVLSIKAQHEMFLGRGEGEPDLTLSLSRLFPFRGTRLSLTYDRSPSLSSSTASSSLQFLVSQPIAQNAFGRSTKIDDQIAGVQIDVARFQIVEAYEDYLAAILTTYYNWYSAYENLLIGRASYRENLKLLDDINKRQEQNIALPIDVNKVKLLVIGKRENVIALEEAFDNITNLIKKAIRHESYSALLPAEPSSYSKVEVEFERDYKRFEAESRTYEVLRLLEDKSTLEVARAADDLLPSTNLLLGYEISGDDWSMNDNERMLFVGFSVEWPFPDKVDRAKHAVSLIEERRTRLTSRNKFIELRTDLKNLHSAMERERTLLGIAEEKIELSRAILEEEAENYSFGKVTLNDYIDAVNRLDENRFNRTLHTIQLKKLVVEWLRITDALVDKKVLMGVEQ